MSIQQGINQLLATASIAQRLSPSYELRQKATGFAGEAKAAYAGLEDISTNLSEGKQYSETQLNDISERVKSHNEKINDYRTALKNPDMKDKWFKSAGNIPTGQNYKNMMEGIEQNLEARKQEAMSKMQEKGNSIVEQKQQYKNLVDAIRAGNENIKDMPDAQRQVLKENPKIREAVSKAAELSKSIKEKEANNG